LKDLSIIIVNYHSSALIIPCLQTVYAYTKRIDFEIIVVDNNSGPEEKEWILAAFPEISWIQMDYNAGFARANNEGIRHTNAQTILLLNADTLLDSPAIEKCYQLFMESSFIACGVQLLNEDRSPQISGNYFTPGGLNSLLPLPYFGKFIKWMGQLTGVRKPNLPDANSTVRVDWINGAFLMVKKHSIDVVGLLDEDFFLYAEEAEWCYRLGKNGPLCIFGAFKIIHLQGETAVRTFGSNNKSYFNIFDKKGLQIILSNLVRIRKQFGWPWFLIIYFFYLLDIPVFFIGWLFDSIFNAGKPSFDIQQFKGYCINMYKLSGYLFKILRNKHYFYKAI
jgi:hypothetical protein